jgi:hypothetical protein
VDIDVLVESLSETIQALAFTVLGPTPLRRVGRAPKILLCYRAENPMKKRQSSELLLDDGTVVQIEVLGEGQQFVGFGMHPVMGAHYTWSDASPETTPFTNLLKVTEDSISEFLAEAERILRKAGGRTRKEREKETATKERTDRNAESPCPDREETGTSSAGR